MLFVKILEGSPPSPKSDVFSFGLLLHFICNGRSPFSGLKSKARNFFPSEYNSLILKIIQSAIVEFISAKKIPALPGGLEYPGRISLEEEMLLRPSSSDLSNILRSTFESEY